MRGRAGGKVEFNPQFDRRWLDEAYRDFANNRLTDRQIRSLDRIIDSFGVSRAILNAF